MSGKDGDIFSDDFKDKTDNTDEQSEFPKIPDLGDDDTARKEKIDVSDKISKGLEKSNKKYMILGAIIIGLIVGGSAYGIQQGIIPIEPFDPSACHYGVHSDFLGQRCMTQEEFEESQKKPEEKKSTGSSQPPASGGGTKDVSSTSDKVELEKTKEPIGYYQITTNDDWYGDYVDFRKIPNKIEKSGSMKVNFRCFTDDFQGTSTYFATFRNVIQDNLKVDVYIGDTLVQSKSTTKNSALILEGSCY